MNYEETNARLDKDIFFKILYFLFLFSILYIPISGIPYVYDSLNGEVVLRGAKNTNFLLTLFRDIIIFMMIFLFLIRSSLLKFSCLFNKNLEPIVLLVLITILCSDLYSLIENGIITVLSGQRIIEFLFLTYISYHLGKLYKNIIFQFEKALSFVLFSEFVICILQTIFMRQYEGKTLFGSRVIGSFNNPNTIGAFFAFTFMFFIFFSRKKNMFKFMYSIISIFGILLTGSRTSIIISAFFIAFLLWKKQRVLLSKILLLSILPFTLITLIYLLPNLSGRMGSIRPLSDDPRWQILTTIFNDASFLNTIFGFGTGVGSNTLISFANTFPQLSDINKNNLVITDSTFTSILFQFGLLGILIYNTLILNISFVLKTDGFLIPIFIMLLSLSNIWFEMYPLNLLLSLLLGIKLSDIVKVPNTKIDTPILDH